MESLSTVLLLIILAGAFIALIRGGWTGQGGVTDWLRAKFLGQTPA